MSITAQSLLEELQKALISGYRGYQGSQTKKTAISRLLDRQKTAISEEGKLATQPRQQLERQQRQEQLVQEIAVFQIALLAVGKKLLAKAKELGVYFYDIFPGTLIGKWQAKEEDGEKVYELAAFHDGKQICILRFTFYHVGCKHRLGNITNFHKTPKIEIVNQAPT